MSIDEWRQRLQRWWEARIAAFFERGWRNRPWYQKLGARLVGLTYLTTREVLRDRAPMTAGSLAFFTVLAVVPLLTVAASLMGVFGMLDAEGGALFERLHSLFPEEASGLANYLSETAIESTQALGGIGGLTLLIIGLVLFNAIEEAMTKIWGATPDRSLVMKLLTFYAVISFGPILLALSVVQTAQAQIYLAEMGFDISFMGRMAPIFYALVAFTLLFKLVPDTTVSWRAALVGGLFTAVVFELAKWGFNLYMSQLLFQTYDRVYGALALIPIGLIWVYITWLVILIGAELAFAFQHLPRLMRREVLKLGDRKSGLAGALHPLTPLAVLAPIVESFHTEKGPVTIGEILEKVDIERAVAKEILSRWEALAVITTSTDQGGEKSYLPCRPIPAIGLDAAVESFWPAAVEPSIEKLSEQYLELSKKFFADYSGRALVDSGRGHTTAEEPGGEEAAE